MVSRPAGGGRRCRALFWQPLGPAGGPEAPPRAAAYKGLWHAGAACCRAPRWCPGAGLHRPSACLGPTRLLEGRSGGARGGRAREARGGVGGRAGGARRRRASPRAPVPLSQARPERGRLVAAERPGRAAAAHQRAAAPAAGGGGGRRRLPGPGGSGPGACSGRGAALGAPLAQQPCSWAADAGSNSRRAVFKAAIVCKGWRPLRVQRRRRGSFRARCRTGRSWRRWRATSAWTRTMTASTRPRLRAARSCRRRWTTARCTRSCRSTRACRGRAAARARRGGRAGPAARRAASRPSSRSTCCSSAWRQPRPRRPPTASSRQRVRGN